MDDAKKVAAAAAVASRLRGLALREFRACGESAAVVAAALDLLSAEFATLKGAAPEGAFNALAVEGGFARGRVRLEIAGAGAPCHWTGWRSRDATPTRRLDFAALNERGEVVDPEFDDVVYRLEGEAK